VEKKSGESKARTVKPQHVAPPTPEVSPSISRASSPTPFTPPSPANQPAPDFKYSVREIPPNLATQKAFYRLLVTSLDLKSVTLRVTANSPSITSTPTNRKNPAPASAPKKPTFSVVIRNVPHDISAEDNATLCPSPSIVKAWRIISRKSNRATLLIQVLSTNKLID
jgi:hypothetical protein